MCSIAGVLWLNDATRPSPETLKDMVDRALAILQNRGPDASATLSVSARCAMGGNRLIIRGSETHGAMPFLSNGSALFYNGEIYNYRNWNRDAMSDGEILLPLYCELKEKAFCQLDGEFAISIWDNIANTVVLVRDPLGTKPLYFSLSKDCLLWASSASAINQMYPHTFCRSTKGPTYKHTYAVQEPYTSYNHIWLLPPGHYLTACPSLLELTCYNTWPEFTGQNSDTSECFDALECSLRSRLDSNHVLGIPMSAGIDSGIIAFMADLLEVKYELFCVVDVFGRRTAEADTIMTRIDRLRKCSRVNCITFGEPEYYQALGEMFLPDYYDSEKYDNGNLLMHAVFNSMHKRRIRVAIDGSGGDEVFHGYKFRDDFRPVDGWPLTWHGMHLYYSLYTTLLDYTAKSDRAGAHFSIEARYPFQTVRLMHASLRLPILPILKWPLRQFLLTRLPYGSPTCIDLYDKYGFSIKGRNRKRMIDEMKIAWLRANHLERGPLTKPKAFPFALGKRSIIRLA